MSQQLKRLGHHVVGVDVSLPVLQAAVTASRHARLAISYLVVEATALPFQSAVFDAALMFKVYCYIPSLHLRQQYLREVARVLRPGSPVLLTNHIVPSAEAAIDDLRSNREHQTAALDFQTLESMDTFAAGSGYVHWFTLDDLLSELAGCPELGIRNVTNSAYMAMVSLQRS
jgi:SAM-dependent methyltransferase